MISRLRAWLTLLLIGTDLFVVSPLIPEVGRTFGVGAASAGWMVSAFSLAYITAGPWFGAVADRRGRWPVLVAALGLFTIANAATGLAPGFAVLLACRAAAGLAASGVTPSVYVLVSASAPPQRQGRWLAVATSGLLIALAVGAPAGALLSSVIGWRGVFGCVAGAAALIGAANLRGARVRAAPGARGAASSRSTEATGAGSTAAAAVPVAAMTRAVSVTGMWALAVYGFYTYLGTGLRGTAHFGTGLVAVSLVACGACAVTGNLAGGPLADRLGGRRVTAASLVALAAAEAGFAAAARVAGGRGGVTAGAVAIAVLGLFALAAYPFFAAHQLRLVRAFPHAAGRLLAWNNTAMYAGIFIGSAAGGRLLATDGFPVLCVSTAAVGVIGAAATRWAIARRPRNAAPSAPAAPLERARRDSGARRYCK